MSDQDDTLLDEDLGDEEYDLGNDEEEALLADDYEIDRQNSYKGEEETDDVLDLGVTDALDDLEGDDENISYRNESDSHNRTHCYNDERLVDCHGGYYDHEEQPQLYEENIGHNEAILSTASMSTGDLREKLQKNNNSAQRDVVIIGNGQQHHHHHHHHLQQQPMEDDDGEEARERRNRFQSERTIISPKMNNEIPDSLESVVTMEQMRPMMMRDRGRGRGIRGMRGARFPGPMPSYNPRFSSRGPSYNEQKPSFRPPLLESRPPLFPNGPPNNMMNPQMMYHQGNQQHLPRFQQYQGGPPAHGPSHHFNDPSGGLRPQYNQFPGMGQVPRMQNPRMEFRPRAPGLRFNSPPNQQQFMPPRPPHFQARPQQHGPEVRQMSNNHESMMPSGPRGPSLLGPGPHPMGPHGQNNQIRPAHPGHPRMLQQGGPVGPNGQNMEGQIPPRFARPGPNHPNVPMGTQPHFENRPFQEAPQFERRNMYAPGQQPQQQQHQQQQPYNNQPAPNQFNNNMPPNGPQQQRGSAVPNVPIPPGHKILINPHFRGTPQPPADGRPQWDGSQQSMPQSQVPNDQNFVQNTTSYQDPVAYNQTPVKQQPSQEFQKTKNEDPYAYFSDVWQENKTSKPKSISPLKAYSAESNYSRDSNYRDYDSKYKSSDTRDTYSEDQRYRDRSPPARSRDYSHRPRSHQSNTTYHSDTYDQRSSRPTNNSSSSRASSRPPQKRSPEPMSRAARELSPKRVKLSNRHFHDAPTSGESHAPSRSRHVEDLDPEMREYHKKMEEQKRLREKILQEKENRRKQAAMEKQGDDSRDAKIPENAQQDEKMTSGTAVVAKNNAESAAQPLATRGRIRTGNTQASEVNERGLSGVRIVRKPPGTEKHSTSTIHSVRESIVDGQKDGGQLRASNQSHQQQSSARRVVINAPSVQRVSTSIQKTVSNLQKNQTPMSTTSNKAQKVLNKPVPILKNVITNDNTRTVIKDGTGSTGPVRKVVVNNALPVNSKKMAAGNSNFQRIVLQPSTKPNTIMIENLATSTSESEIRRMCQGIGTLESVVMGDKTATIVFKTHSAATVFQKKYQRKMIDLSMINVRLLNQTVSIKRPTIK